MPRLILSFAAVLLVGAGAAHQEEVIETLRELAAPDPVHALLARRQGSWEASGRYWLPDGTTGDVEGTIESTLEHGGLFVESRVRGQLLGEPYEGRSILGFDTAVGEVVEVWFDNLGTGIYRYTGECQDPECRRMTLTTSFVDPVWGSDMTSRIEVTWQDDDTYAHEAWLTHADGREFPQLEYTARRIR